MTEPTTAQVPRGRISRQYGVASPVVQPGFRATDRCAASEPSHAELTRAPTAHNIPGFGPYAANSAPINSAPM